MAIQQIQSSANLFQSRLSQTIQSLALSNHKRSFSATLRDIPAAADAMRHLRHTNPQPPRTVFLLDWDDTCCATSFLERCGLMASFDINLYDCPSPLIHYLRILEQHVLTLLKQATRLGTVLIITNAGDGWVELSSARFLPAVKAYLDQNRNQIKIVSARARYIDTHRHEPLQWKVLTFSDELQTIMAAHPCKPYEMNVVVLGDSVGDQYAARYTANLLASNGMPVVMKVVKFLERPSIDQLCKEIAVFLDHLYVITMHNGSFDVSMYKECNSNYDQVRQQCPQAGATSIVSSSDQGASPHHAHSHATAVTNTSASLQSEAQHATVSTVPSVAECAAVV